MKKWDFDRMLSFLAEIAENASLLQSGLEDDGPGRMDMGSAMRRVMHLDRTLKTIKGLLRAERRNSPS